MATARRRYVPGATPAAPGAAQPAGDEESAASESAICPKCGAAFSPGESFCAACGSALSAAVEARQGKLVLDKKKLLARTIRRNWGAGAGYIMGAAIIQFVMALIVFLALPGALGRMAGAVWGALGAVFLLLWFWAWRAPLPALVTALVVYVLTIPFHIGGLGLIVVNIVTIIGLAGGIRAALANRRLARRMRDGQPLRGRPGRWR